ncbi:MAG TPA: hypothetical protein VK137_14265 [Planctomycetaceae bacterium]|nr:hypothetical protein [Planctomycetaceae bacterium]
MTPVPPHEPQTRSNVGGAVVDDDSDVLDWDFSIETAPQRPSGVVYADAEFVGRSRPIPLDDQRVRKAE